MAKIKNSGGTKCWERCEEFNLSHVAGGKVKGTGALEDSLALSYNTKY